ncbi:hypothetical protein Vadar_024310 [Vaccinium darrowii]|uniref:Uncharacterized protein n=1 Tax=Vaccinium darrowii TaxID=229202 RepID=A0ACB7Y2Y7_9ERIC|nr:hypothetical protein Vadar_024310 [Vaccinium darrowii]
MAVPKTKAKLLLSKFQTDGYVGVDESEDVQLFYYFVKSESNPKEDPLLLWLSGGPGCSSFYGLIYEIGPLYFKAMQRDGSLPELVLNPNSWSKVASIIYLDLPVGTGFSYARTSLASYSTDLQACDQAYQFLRKWLMDHPEFLSNPFYVAGDSYSGMMVPLVVQLISNGKEIKPPAGNEAGIDPFIHLKGYLLGNPVTNYAEENYKIPYAHGMGLISDELYEDINGLNIAHILEPHCDSVSSKPWEFFSKRRSLDDTNKELVVWESSPCPSSRTDGYRLSESWLNDDSVREALHIQKGSTGEWVLCNRGLPYTTKVTDTFQYHVNLSTKGFKSLIYSGDHDMVVPFFGTQVWIRSLNYSIVDDWRSWVVQGQVAGYVGVDESQDVQLFYYFVKSESNPKEDPLVLWLSGGPGCSSISGLIYEIGPLIFKATHKDGSLPELVLNPYSWSHVASIIYLDLPVGTGFSYARTSLASYSTDLQTSDQAYEFLRKWLMDHPEFLLNPFYVAGDSYAGLAVPIIVQLISNGNEAGVKPFIDLKGYLLGNPVTYSAVESNYRIPFAHGMGLISDELFESLQRNCKGEYFNVDPNNKECLEDVETYTQVTNGVNTPYILEPFCGYASPNPPDLFSKRRSLDDTNKELVASESSPCASSRIDGYRLSHSWLNNDDVREALHVRTGSTGEWIRCNDGLPYNTTVEESFEYHVNLSTKAFKSLVYSGDHDMFVPFLGTQAWIRSLNCSIVDDWRLWVVQGQVSGYTRTYSNGMTFATVKGGGHTAPEFKPIECYDMFKRWISHQPL